MKCKGPGAVGDQMGKRGVGEAWEKWGDDWNGSTGGACAGWGGLCRAVGRS